MKYLTTDGKPDNLDIFLKNNGKVPGVKPAFISKVHDFWFIWKMIKDRYIFRKLSHSFPQTLMSEISTLTRTG